MRKILMYTTGVFDDKKYLKSIVEGIICELVISGNSYVNQERLTKAINQYFVDRHVEIDKTELAKIINKIFLSLYIHHKIVPDVLYGNGYIISDNCTQTEKSLDKFLSNSNTVARASVSPTGFYGFPMLYSSEDARIFLASFNKRSRELVKSLTYNYNYNYMDIYEVFKL